jgi:hypothetical protein
MPRYKVAYGWMDGGKFYLSMLPKTSNAARNVYDNPHEALRDAHPRKLSIQWEDPAAVDAWIANAK